jgi:hypothetical protein
VSVTGVVAPAPPSVTLVWAGLSYWTALDRPVDSELRPVDNELAVVEVDVERLSTVLLVVLRPVDSELTPVDNELAVVEVDVDRLPTVLLVVLKPVDSELTPVDSELAVVDVDVDRLPTVLFVVLRPVDSELTPVDNELAVVAVDVDRLSTVLLVVLRPVDNELIPVDVVVDSDVSWPKFTASVGFTPSATFVSVTGAVAVAPPSVTLVCSGLSYWTALDRPVDSEATLLFVVLKPVESELTPVDSELAVVEVDVDRLVTVLLLVLKPVDSELMLVEVDVDSVLTPVDSESSAELVALSCEPLIASVLVALIRPAATLVIWRSAPDAPTLTTLAGVVPAKLYV